MAIEFGAVLTARPIDLESGACSSFTENIGRNNEPHGENTNEQVQYGVDELSGIENMGRREKPPPLRQDALCKKTSKHG